MHTFIGMFNTGFNHMRKIISIISAIMIAIASVGFLIIPQLFEFRINKLKDENESIISSQRDASDFIQKSISAMLNYSLFRDNLDLFKSISLDLDKIKKKESDLLFNSANSAQFALSAAIAIKKIDQKTYASETEKIMKAFDLGIHKEYCMKYMEIASKGTQELDESRKKNLRTINNLSFWKDALWYFCFFIQSIGFILAIIALGTETDK
ncbi:MAG: hypothetical protein C4517_00495 [Stygiobacter sp.]|nr:MAG: hypothetical protein C4517_00495 [Stygiobacter sp.]